MKKIVSVVIGLLLFIPNVIWASTTYNNGKDIANKYIYDFQDYSRYIKLTGDLPYGIDSATNKPVTHVDFKTGGFLNEKEYDMNITISGEEQDKNASKDKLDLLGSLRKKGEEIYKAKQYTKYSERNGAYFISLEELEKDFKFDISPYKGSDGTACDKENSGLFFDVDGVMDTNRDKETPPIIPMLIACTQAEQPQNNKKALDN